MQSTLNGSEKEALLRILKSREPTQLATLLTVYEKAKYEAYIDYMFGAKELINWLSPIKMPEVPKDFTFSPILLSYEIQELAKHLAECSQLFSLGVQAAWVKAIIYVKVQEASS